MTKYKIIVTPDAKDDLRLYLDYIRNVKKNPQAVKSILQDFRDTKNRLSLVAGSLSEPESEKMKEMGLKRMNFIRHDYFMLYCIRNGNEVYITNIFHFRESFESKLR